MNRDVEVVPKDVDPLHSTTVSLQPEFRQMGWSERARLVREELAVQKLARQRRREAAKAFNKNRVKVMSGQVAGRKDEVKKK